MADVKMRIFNRDGSEAEMCGNGLRCVAAHLNLSECLVETLSGIHKCGKEGDLYWTELHVSPVSKKEVEGVTFYCVNTGVPHWVFFPRGNFEIVAPKICHEYNTNVNGITLGSPYTVRTFERGVGETLACGTGIAASHLALRSSGRVGDDAQLVSKSGSLFLSKIIDEHTLILHGSVVVS